MSARDEGPRVEQSAVLPDAPLGPVAHAQTHALELSRKATNLQVAVAGETYRGETSHALDVRELCAAITRQADRIDRIWQGKEADAEQYQ